jgi:hypothetical protein
MSILINDKPSRVHYLATSGQTVFAIPFEWLSDAHIIVFVNEVRMAFSAPPFNASQYSLNGVGVTGGGHLTFGPPGRKLNDEVVIYRDMPVSRTTDLPTTGPFPVPLLNQTFDAQVVMIQQAETGIQRRTLGLRAQDFTEVLRQLPNRNARAGRYLAFDFDGQPILVGPDGSIGGGGSTSLASRIFTSDVPPPTPWLDGMLWWNTQNGGLYLYYVDADSGQWVQINFSTGTVAQGPETSNADIHIEQVVLTAASGTWQKPPGCRWYRLRGVGGGGAGGDVDVAANNLFGAAGGGASGGYGETPWVEASGISGANYVIGQGGSNLAGGLNGAAGGSTVWVDGVRTFQFNGGTGGAGSSGATVAHSRPGGAPGSVGGSPVNIVIVGGGTGQMGLASTIEVDSGAGGDCPLGQGGRGQHLLTGHAGGLTPTEGYGGGGGGAARTLSGSLNSLAGGSGADGAIVVEEMF